MACKQLLLNARRAWFDFEVAMAHLAEIEEKVASDKVQLEAERAKIEQDREQLKEDRIEFDAEREAMAKLGAGSNDLISLSFRGEKAVTVKRSTLCQIEGPMMAAMFSGRYDDKLDFDRGGNVFLSYPPQVMLPLVDWLTANLDLAAGTAHAEIDIPSEYRGMWEGALNFFGLETVVRPQPLPIISSGIKTNLKMSALEGWDMVFCKPYSHITTMEDFQLPGVAGDSAVLVGARRSGADELLLAAIGRLDVIRAQTDLNCTRLHNGVHWYCTAGKSIGFAPDAKVDMNACDVHDRGSPCRMSWYLGGNGGDRAGPHFGLYGSHQKVIMEPRWSLMMKE